MVVFREVRRAPNPADEVSLSPDGHAGIPRGPRGRARRDRRRVLVEGGRPVRRLLLPPDVRDHGRLPPLLLAPDLPARARSAVPSGVSRADLSPEGGPLVGVEPPSPPPLLRPARRHPQPDAEGLLVGARRLDPRPGLRQDRPVAGAGPGKVPGARL